MQRFAKFKKSLGMASEAPKNFKNLRRLLARSVFFFFESLQNARENYAMGLLSISS